jgi:hypothetical protein
MDGKAVLRIADSNKYAGLSIPYLPFGLTKNFGFR